MEQFGIRTIVLGIPEAGASTDALVVLAQSGGMALSDDPLGFYRPLPDRRLMDPFRTTTPAISESATRVPDPLDKAFDISTWCRHATLCDKSIAVPCFGQW